MGWTSGNMTRSDIIAEQTSEWVSDNGTSKWATLRKSTSGNTLWMVKARFDLVEGEWVEREGCRWIGCTLMQKFGSEWGYKCLEEAMGPSQVSCPLAYLDMVPEPEKNYNWRENVRGYWANRKAQKSWKSGDILDLGGEASWPSILVKARYVEVIDGKTFFPITDIRQNGEGLIVKSGQMVGLSKWTRQSAKVISAYDLRSAWMNQG